MGVLGKYTALARDEAMLAKGATVVESSHSPLVTTIKERCRSCYTCVRECPAKAIRISNGQAEVLPWRCIGCGNCVRVCSQKAKQVRSGLETVARLLAEGPKVAACLAPSFPAEFTDISPANLVGLLRQLGFHLVTEVGFGADLVAREYRRLLAQPSGDRHIATTCPAVVAFVQKYHPHAVPSLAPIVSPMIALARALHRIHGRDLRVVFIGPCIAKKEEILDEDVLGEVDAVLTFAELRKLFETQRLVPGRAAPSDFDPPRAGLGGLFPITRGMLQTAHIDEDLMTGEVVAAAGRSSFLEVIKEFEHGDLDARLVEVLCCKGCIMGPGMTSREPLFRRRAAVSQQVRTSLGEQQDLREERLRTQEMFVHLDLGRSFTASEQREWSFSREVLDEVRACMGSHAFSVRDLWTPGPTEQEVRAILDRLGKHERADELNCGACGYETCREHAIAIHRGLAESEMCLPYTIEQLRRTLKDLACSHDQLRSTQEALMQSEKLASMGQLAAGIAHEVNNPLGVVLMYAHLLLEERGASDERLGDDLRLIAEQADRCKKIVGGLLNFARQNKVVLQPVDLRELVERGLRALPPPPGIEVRLEHEIDDPQAELDRDQILQVLTNLVSNAYGAMSGGGRLTVRTRGDADRVFLLVEDTGVGISAENMARLFQPFFTTKQLGQGTGLGLAVSYGIVKMHRGDIRVMSNADPKTGPTGTSFVVSLPRRGPEE
ncbi:MAG: [Fe-Fe] hydrogenase large subunit C-terminal domain-containing protein [Myxococcota bacterium]|jgi:signal transduction histidine kinase/iron only hydrogenase large subunit-like protein|nr:[Fe-Fe] hydrogenase large subunit C-terminal domain-containing protein [Myxococcota bacterium]